MNIQREDLVEELQNLVEFIEINTTGIFRDYVLVNTLSMFHLRYESEIAFVNSEIHPYLACKSLIEEVYEFAKCLCGCSFAAEQTPEQESKEETLISRHQSLWQEIWTRHSKEEYLSFVKVKRQRFEVNDLTSKVLGKKCVEFGCGNAVILAALKDMGASSCHGIDFGENNIHHAKRMLSECGYNSGISVSIGNVLKTPFEDDSYDFAVANGVFHHLEENTIPIALSEVFRVLKPGGYFWYYVDGNSLAGELWDVSVAGLKEVDPKYMESIFTSMGLSRDKKVHLVDSLNAVYIHNTYEGVCNELAQAGFEDFIRMQGGRHFDMDPHKSEDPYAKEKFGDGAIRILSRKPLT